MTDITTPFPATPYKLGLYPVVDSGGMDRSPA
ncbi:Uncharacterised protein [Serratia marcescens]|uniref:Uncharacterized protein n=1 Tax=Serratia marcescens TaxID=615 RepID=A0A379Y4T6_SERMA|nr:Uncharacterised protein [Serratia marcescens]